MAVAFASQGAASLVLSSSIILAKPSGLAVGDLMIALLATSSGTVPTITAPAGWTGAAATTWSSGSGGFLAAGYKVADAADVAAANFTFTGASGGVGAMSGYILRFTGADPTTPLDGTSTSQITTTGATGNFPGMTTTVANALVVHAAIYTYAATPNGTQWSTAAPSGTTLAGNGNNATYSSAFAAAVFTQVSAGATGNKTIPLNGTRSAASDFQAITFAIAPTSGAQTLAPEVLTNASTLYGPTVTPSAVSLAPPVVANTSVLHAPSVSQGASLGAPLLTNTSTIHAATATPGAITLTPSQLANMSVLHTAAVTPGGVTVSPGRLTNTSVVQVGAVTPGPVALSPGVLANLSSLYAPTASSMSGDQTLLPDRLDNASLVYAPIIPGAAQSLQPGVLINLSVIRLPTAANDNPPGTYPLAIAGGPSIVAGALIGGGAVMAGFIPITGRVIATALKGRP